LPLPQAVLLGAFGYVGCPFEHVGTWHGSPSVGGVPFVGVKPHVLLAQTAASQGLVDAGHWLALRHWTHVPLPEQ